MKHFILAILLACTAQLAWSQQNNNNANVRLANQYYVNGEYEKAAILYDRLYTQNNRQEYYLSKYVDCLLALESYDKAEEAIQIHLAKYQESSTLYVTYGKLLERLGRQDEAETQYQKAIDHLPADRFQVIQLANLFMAQANYDLAEKAYEKGLKELKDKADFSYYMAEMYRRKGDQPKMIHYYLESLDEVPARLPQIKSLFQRFLYDDDLAELQRQLYERLQANPGGTQYNDLLTWVFIQQKAYDRALRQEMALDRRLGENGMRVFNLGEIALNADDYATAINAYKYILTDKGPSCPFYMEAKRKSLVAKREELASGGSFDDEQLGALETEFETFIQEVGTNAQTALIVMDLAKLEAFYLKNLKKAIGILENLKETPGINNFLLAQIKLQLADYYLMDNNIWDATLLYSQVDKSFKEEEIGEEARFKNARLSYFAGDFEWAQKQFDILKASTSKLIANDALDLSIFIMDNLGLDTTARPLKMYADAELLSFQNRDDEAQVKLDSINQIYPDHGLDDDVIYLKAQIAEKDHQYQQAANLYEEIVTDHADEIRADNALFKLASLYENQLLDIEKAKSLYEKLFIEFSNSTFAVDARKRYRILRGDQVQ
ncbi:MAG: tetratricopeptide repeat protein [Saprospiraceae bacterium]